MKNIYYSIYKRASIRWNIVSFVAETESICEFLFRIQKFHTMSTLQYNFTGKKFVVTGAGRGKNFEYFRNQLKNLLKS